MFHLLKLFSDTCEKTVLSNCFLRFVLWPCSMTHVQCVGRVWTEKTAAASPHQSPPRSPRTLAHRRDGPSEAPTCRIPLVLLAYIKLPTEKTKCFSFPSVHLCCSHNHLCLTYSIFAFYYKAGLVTCLRSLRLQVNPAFWLFHTKTKESFS